MTDEQERARMAQAALNNPMLEEAFSVLREGYIQASMACKPDDDLNRWRYTAALRGLTTIRNHLNAVVQRGSISREQIAELAEVEKRENVFKRTARGLWGDNAAVEKSIT